MNVTSHHEAAVFRAEQAPRDLRHGLPQPIDFLSMSAPYFSGLIFLWVVLCSCSYFKLCGLHPLPHSLSSVSFWNTNWCKPKRVKNFLTLLPFNPLKCVVIRNWLHSLKLWMTYDGALFLWPQLPNWRGAWCPLVVQVWLFVSSQLSEGSLHCT